MLKFFESSAITAAWAQASARPVEGAAHTAADAYVSMLRAEYAQGNVAYAELELDLADDVFALAAHDENWKYSQLLELLWLVPGVAAQLPPLGAIRPEVRAHFAPEDEFGLAASLSRTLHRGGAYTSRAMSTTDCLALGVAFAAELMEGLAGRAFVATGAWCDFFLDVAWDHAVIVVLPGAKRVKLLLATDED